MSARQFTIGRFRRLAPVLLAVFACVPSVVRGADARPVEEFLKLESNWPTFADVKLQFRIEGRYSSISRTGLRLRNCPLLFKAAEGFELPKPAGTGANVEVGGYLTRDDGKIVFIVERLSEAPSDAETLRVRQARLRADQPDEWYELAAWAAGRAKFYEDEQLQQDAENVYRRGLATERRQAPNDPEHLLALAGKADRFKLPESLQQELTHEAYQLRWQKVARTDAAALKALDAQMVRDLAGAQLPLAAAEPELRTRYLESPLKTYEAVPAAERRKLHRLLYAELVGTTILLDAKPDGSNGAAIAAALDRRLPEWKAVAAQHRDKELDYRLSQVGTLTKEEAVALRDEFAVRKQPEKSRQTIERWLKVRAGQLREDDTAGRIHLADEYVRLLDDRAAARDLLAAAYARNPASEDAADALRRLGFRLEGEAWVSREEMKARPGDPVQQAIREGRVSGGMTREQVRKALGVPTSVSRVATSGQINEIWLYQQPGGSPLAVHFLRSTRTSSEAGVVGVSPVAAR